MNWIGRSVVSLVVTAAIVLPTSVLAEEYDDPFNGVLKLTQWFEKLTAEFDKVVVAEQREQWIRIVDKLRTNLYSVETASERLKKYIPDKKPDANQARKLESMIYALRGSISGLGDILQKVGPDIRFGEGGYEVERALDYGLETRRSSLTYLESAVELGPWDANDLRSRLDQGIEAVRNAQLAVTAFRRKLSQTQ